MSIKLQINSITIDGDTKLNFVPNSGEGKIASSDATGFVGYSSVVLASSDENLPVDGSVFTGGSNIQLPGTKNKSYVVKTNILVATPLANTSLFIEVNGQTTKTGDKVRILALTKDGYQSQLSPLTYINSSSSTNGRWLISGLNSEVLLGSTKVHMPPPQPDNLTNYNYFKIPKHNFQELTLLYSPLGPCKYGVRSTLVYPSPPGQIINSIYVTAYTYTATDYVWYGTKATHFYLGMHLSTGTPPTPITPDPFPNPDPFPGPGGGGF